MPVDAAAAAQAHVPATESSSSEAREAYVACFLLGLGGLFSGVTGPLLSNFVPLIIRDTLGDARTAIGGVMAIDNVLLLLLVPLAGAASDRARARGRGRLSLVLFGFALAAAGMALFPFSAAFGIAGVIGAMVVLYGGTNVQRSPFYALLADGVPSKYRSLATGSFTFQMCVGAIVFLMLGRAFGMQIAFLVAAGTVVAIAGALALWIREPAVSQTQAVEATYGALADAVWSSVRGAVPGLRLVFLSTLLLQLTFQTFTTWFSLHGTERFGVSAEDVTLGMIAWALGGAIGDPLNGGLFDLFGSYRALFLIMAGYTALAFWTVLLVPRGAGEAFRSR